MFDHEFNTLTNKIVIALDTDFRYQVKTHKNDFLVLYDQNSKLHLGHWLQVKLDNQ